VLLDEAAHEPAQQKATTDMKPQGFSETALGAAVIRALHLEFGDPIVFADRFAGTLVPEKDRERVLAHMLELISPAEKRAALAMDDRRERSAFILRAIPFTATSLVTYRYAEDCLAAALRKGISQCVILGAGIDSTALRLPETWPGVRVFEVDHPATQELKKDLVRRLGLKSGDGATFVPVDFEQDDMGGALLAAGFERDRPVFVSWLNVTVYLSQDAVLNALTAISALSAAASELVLDFCGEDMRRLRDGGVARMFRTAEALGEPMGGGLSSNWLRGTLSGLGYAYLDLHRPEDLADLRALADRNGYRFMPACYIATAVRS
jgi:methyltransferase (TIGR00027 family)